MSCYYKYSPNHNHNQQVNHVQKCKTDINIKVKCNDDNGNGNGETAAFRAVNNEPQLIEDVNTFYKVLFQEEQFDIGDIYNANNSTFVPRESGVYYVAGTVTFTANDGTIPYRVRVEIRVNGVSVAADNDFWAEIDDQFLYVNAINVATILQLEAGDLVEVFLTSTAPGTIAENVPDFSTRFEAAKFR
ncbi:hypothetical protein AB685_08375 [Bacillus sp. LL01]|uniref:hypothetical protein n=1 Tax=Bacillus sp. LL01 TaxID=1665556 RepID=UPI00064D5A33|nr:hypothetical protein [Bacillus sp. LL01]KMJ59071.1 hypothetical protein AB685_08375 [Bacillus sp. LL01]